MHKVDSKVDCGSRLVFCRYMDEESLAVEDRIFTPGQFLVVGGINEDGGLQCYPTDETGTLTSIEGDTLFEEEVIHLAYAPKLDVRAIL